MEQVATQTEADLFGQTIPQPNEIEQISLNVYSDEKNTMEFAELVEQNAQKRSAKANLTGGIGYYILGEYAQAAEKLEKADDCAQKFMYLAFANRELGNFEDAVKNLDKASKNDADKLTVALEKASTYRQADNFEKAEKELQACSNYDGVSAEYHYQLGRLLEDQGLYIKAAKNYEKAIELEPKHAQARFHLAYRCDLLGDEESAIEHYKQLQGQGTVYVNAMLNLAVIYEDKAEYEKALSCVRKVLKNHPNHKRARLFEKDIRSSRTMFYDEEWEKRIDRKNQMLETPLTDFELSVRSRNCLQKMNIETIGDLLNITESELLSYKNFGETSLKEIKEILDSKGLYLGMAREDTDSSESNDQQEQQQEQFKALYENPIEDLQLSVRAKKCLEKLDIKKIGDLAQITEAELLGCKNFGVTSLNEVKKALADLGLSLRKID